MELRDQVAYYGSHPPRCLAGFTAVPAKLPGVAFDGHASGSSVSVSGVSIEGPEHINAVFRLACACGHERHHVFGYHWRNPDFRNELVFLSPLTLRCASCDKETELIDTDRHGYDAELGGIVATVRGEGNHGEYSCDRCGPQAFQEFRGRAQDLFSWFGLVGKCPGCSRLLSIADFECA